MEDGLTLAIGGTAFGAVCTLIGSLIRARYSKTQIEPQPLQVSLETKFANKESNDEAHRDLFARVSALEKAAAATNSTLSELKDQLHRMDDKLDRLLFQGAQFQGVKK